MTDDQRPPSLGDQIDGRGWFSGTVVPASMMPGILPYLARHGELPVEIGADDWLVLVSQTCDIVCQNEEPEPFVEVLLCRPIRALRPEYQGRKSTRLLDFRPNPHSHPDVFLSGHAVRDRYSIPRNLLLLSAPDPNRSLGDAAIANIQQWYALRYTRPAWPDAFNERFTRGAKKRLASALKSITTDEIEVRVAIAENEVELPEDEPYHLAVFFVVDQVAWDSSPEVREEAHLAFANFVSAIKECPNILVNAEVSAVLNGDACSWQLTRTTDEWNFANLSDND